MVMLGIRTILFKVDDSRNKNITDTRNIEVSVIKTVKSTEKVLTLEGDQDGDGRWSEIRDSFFVFFFSFCLF